MAWSQHKLFEMPCPTASARHLPSGGNSEVPPAAPATVTRNLLDPDNRSPTSVCIPTPDLPTYRAPIREQRGDGSEMPPTTGVTPMRCRNLRSFLRWSRRRQPEGFRLGRRRGGMAADARSRRGGSRSRGRAHCPMTGDRPSDETNRGAPWPRSPTPPDKTAPRCSRPP